MICFICKQDISTFSALIVHLKIIHLLKSSSTYECIENQCTQIFPNLNSYKRHVTIKHLKNAFSLPTSTLNNSYTICDNINNVNNTIVKTPEPLDTAYSHDITKTNYNQQPPPESHNSFDLSSIINSFHISAVTFTLSLLNKNNFSRKDVFDIQQKMKISLLEPIVSLLTSFTKETIKEPILLATFQTITSAISDTFNFCNTEYSLNSWLVENHLFENIQQFTVNEEIDLVSNSGKTMYNNQITKGVLLPINFQFKKFFEHDNNLDKTLTIYEQLTKNTNNETEIKHFVQGKLWQEKTLPYRGKITIPYFMYIDDFEINNPLGSHASVHSISAIYYSFPLSDQSKLINIHLAALIKAADVKDFGNDLCFNKLIHILNDIEVNGINITTSNGVKKVHFILGLFIGDNLGINAISEFSRSFSSNFFCRFCKAHKTVTHKLCKENNSLLRNLVNYAEDVAINDLKLNGISKESILNKIVSFHVTTNYSVDMMHDIFEGICHYNMCHIINYYTNVVKIFSLDLLNYRKQNFNYGAIEIGNISPIIKSTNLNNFHLKMSAREMMTFVYYFPLMVGDLVPEDDNVWLFFLNFLEIIQNLLSSQMSDGSIFHLQQMIEKHNSEYVLLFNDNLKPKFHLLIHYPTVIKYSGPPKHFWCFRYEAKHKEMKSYAHAITSRKNITLSLAKKFQYKFSYSILQSSFNTEIITNKIHVNSSNYTQLILRNLNLTSDQFMCYSQMEFKGTTYKVGYFLTNFIDELCLYEILEILVIKKNYKVNFIVQQIEIDLYNSHLKSYQINKTKNIILKKILSPGECSGPPVNLHELPNGNIMLRLKEYYSD